MKKSKKDRVRDIWLIGFLANVLGLVLIYKNISFINLNPIPHAMGIIVIMVSSYTLGSNMEGELGNENEKVWTKNL